MMHAYCNNCNKRQFYLHIEERKDEKRTKAGLRIKRKEACVTSKFITSTYLKM